MGELLRRFIRYDDLCHGEIKFTIHSVGCIKDLVLVFDTVNNQNKIFIYLVREFLLMSFLQFITYTGIFVFALTGAFKARAFKMDVFGGIVLAFATAYGGGTLRDLFIGIRPVNWVNDNIALILVFAGTAFTFLLKENVNRFKRTIFYTDAIGLGLFTAWGIEVALRNGINDLYSLVMGVLTATFGGLIADILCSAIPNLLKKGELYATACAIGGGVYLLLKQIPLEYNTNLTICVIVVVGIRIYSKRKRLTLPDI